MKTATALALALLLLVPLTGRAQDQAKSWRVGILHVGLDHVPAAVDGLREGLTIWGLEEGRNIQLDVRNVADDEAARVAAQELVAGNVDALVAIENAAVRAAKAATTKIPILFVHATDPVANRFVGNAIHPEENLTGYAGREFEKPARQLASFREVVPKLKKVLVLLDPADPSTRARLAETREAAKAMKLELVERPITADPDVERAVGLVKAGNTNGVYVVSTTLPETLHPVIVRLATQRKVPLAGLRKDWVAKGALFFFGPDTRDVGRASARYLDRLLKGGSIWDMPVEFSQSELVINMKTAQALGLPVPKALIARAGQVIR